MTSSEFLGLKKNGCLAELSSPEKRSGVETQARHGLQPWSDIKAARSFVFTFFSRRSFSSIVAMILHSALVAVPWCIKKLRFRFMYYYIFRREGNSCGAYTVLWVFHVFLNIFYCSCTTSRSVVENNFDSIFFGIDAIPIINGCVCSTVQTYMSSTNRCRKRS